MRSDSPTALPVYVQISEVLIREIAAGRLVDGERLPPERELARQHGTTVRTLRKALAELAKRGLLDRRQGSGNYVRSSGRIESVYAMFRLELKAGGGLPTATTIDLEECEKPAEIPGFGTSRRATRIRRLRLLDGLPVAIEEIWLDRDAGEVDRQALSDSLYRYYKVRLGFWITRAEDFVSIDRVPDWAPEAFNVKAGEVTGFVERFSWAQAPAPVEYSRTWFDSGRAFYVQRLK